MSDSLLVPIELDVLLADPALAARDNFLCWKYAYINLNDNTFHSPEPPGFNDTYTKVSQGAYLHWELPRSLRSGREGSSSDYPLVPNRWLIVRIYRDNSGNNVQKAWVLESDCPSSDANHASYFMVSDTVVNGWKNSSEPNRNTAAPVAISTVTNTGAYTVNIGKSFDLADWKEQTSGNLFLTAVAPGNLAFSAYVPHNDGVFSFYDDLLDAPSSTLLSYFVTGWYSDLSGDIAIPGSANFTGASSIGEVLKALNWTIAEDLTPDGIDNSLYTGMAFALPWNSNATAAPAPDQLEDTLAARNLTVAIGNNSVDAFSTLIGNQITLSDYTDQNKVIELVRAFHYDLLPILNQVNGDELLQERFRQEWFASKYSGKKWAITFDKTTDGSPGSPSLTDDEKSWLLQLNLDQKLLDDAMEELYSMQWELNAAWWKKNYMSARAQSMSPNQTGIKISDLEKLLDTAQPGSLLTKVISQLALIDQQLPKVPQPVNDQTLNAQDSFLNGVTAFASKKGIGTGKSLKAVTQSRFWKPNNPTVLISGVEPSTITDPDDSLVVRLSSQLVKSFSISGNTITGPSLGNIIPVLTNSNVLPSGVPGLYQEFFLLDPANAQQIAIKTGTDGSLVSKAMTDHDPKAFTDGILPVIDLKTWTQEWNPLYLEWEITYTPIAFEQVDRSGARTRNWSFNGTDYDLKTSAAASGSAKVITGRSLLSPHTQFTFGARLKAFVDQYGKTEKDLNSLYDAIQKADSWKFLSQELVNFNDFLSQRDPRTFRRPTSEMFATAGTNISFAKVIGFTDGSSIPPYDTPSYGQGLVNTIPAVNFSGPSDFPFHGIRSGQCYLSHIVLYDKFGRILDLIDSAGSSGLHDANNFPLVRDNAFLVDHNLNPAITAPFQLPPRLLQPARLDMLLVDQADPTKVLDYAAEVNPVCGWVIANHLDQSLLIYAPDGSSMGEIRLIQGSSGAPLALWSAPPHNATTTIPDIAAIAPQLAAFVTTIQGKTVAEFQEFLGVIDSTLWTTDPLGSRTDQNLSVLIGRPLALLSVMLQFSLDGTPIASCDWPAPVKAPKLNPAIPDFTSSDFSIRFGNLLSREDGVIGYFENQDYSIFNSVATPQAEQGYVRQIGPLAGQDGNYINLPFDGKTTETITLLVDPRASIHATTGIFPVKELKIPARFIDSALSNMEISFRVGPLLSRTQASSINYLPVSEKNGKWSWWENTVTDPGTVPAIYSWQGFELNDADTTATLNDSPATLHEGFLQFVTNFDPGTQ